MTVPRVFRATVIVSGCTATSRVLGFVREILMAVFFGTSLAKSAFDVAFRIPNLFRRLFGEGALSAAFIPVFTASLEQEGRDAANGLANKTITMLAVSLTAIVCAGLLIIGLTVHAAELGQRPAAVMPLLAIMLPYMVFICLVALAMAILNSLHHFTVPAATPVVLNIVWILSILAVAPLCGETPAQRIYGVAWAILAAGIVQLLIQLPALRAHGIRVRPAWHWHDRRVRAVLLAMGPTALGMGVMQINVVVDGILALWVGAWAPAALTYAERLIYLPLGIFATALGTVLLPTFSRQAARGRPDEIAVTLARGIGSLMLIVVPAAVGLHVLAAPITELAFAWRGGQFDSRSTVLTARALRFYAPGLVTFSLYKLLLPLFYARRDPRTPLRVGLVAVGLNFALNITFVLTWPRDYGHAGLACATVLTSVFSCICLARFARRHIGPIGWLVLAGVAWKTLAAALVMAVASLAVHSGLAGAGATAAWPAKVQQLTAVGGGIAAGVAVYVVGIGLLCPDRLRDVWRRLRR